LVDVLLTNLIKNAFFHNSKRGFIAIKTSSNSFEIRNSSDASEIPRERLFQRFSKQSSSRESWGLGLAITKKICDVYGWSLIYSWHENVHIFSVQFR
jgi:K+-sensing histidine kinase KdpD